MLFWSRMELHGALFVRRPWSYGARFVRRRPRGQYYSGLEWSYGARFVRYCPRGQYLFLFWRSRMELQSLICSVSSKRPMLFWSRMVLRSPIRSVSSKRPMLFWSRMELRGRFVWCHPRGQFWRSPTVRRPICLELVGGLPKRQRPATPRVFKQSKHTNRWPKPDYFWRSRMELRSAVHLAV